MVWEQLPGTILKEDGMLHDHDNNLNSDEVV